MIEGLNGSILFLAVLSIAFWILTGIIVVGPSIFLANVLPAKPPIGALTVIIVHLAALLGCMPIIILLIGGDFSRFYNFYIQYLLLSIIPILIFGLITGLLTYFGVRLWRNRMWKERNGHFLFPLRLTTSLGLLLLGWILLSLGLVFVLIITGMSHCCV